MHVRVSIVRTAEVSTRYTGWRELGGGVEENAEGLGAEVDGVVCVGVEGGYVGGEEVLGGFGRAHVLGDPVVDGDDGLFLGDEAAADV